MLQFQLYSNSISDRKQYTILVNVNNGRSHVRLIYFVAVKANKMSHSKCERFFMCLVCQRCDAHRICTITWFFLSIAIPVCSLKSFLKRTRKWSRCEIHEAKEWIKHTEKEGKKCALFPRVYKIPKCVYLFGQLTIHSNNNNICSPNEILCNVLQVWVCVYMYMYIMAQSIDIQNV